MARIPVKGRKNRIPNSRKPERQTPKASASKRMNRRFRVVTAFFFVLMGIIVIRLLWIIAFDGNKYAKAALAQSERSSITLTSKRGDIIDRNNVQLATSTKVYNLILDPRVILSNEERYLEPTVKAIEQCFGIKAEELNKTIRDNPESSYVTLKKELTYAEVEGFLNMKADNPKINGAWLEEKFKRNYTYGTLASSVIGFTDADKGVYGLENQYDDNLTGIDGTEYSYVDSNNELKTERKDARDGDTIKTTLDYNIQAIVEKYIAAMQKQLGAKTVACVIQDPNNGEILAMADSNNFNPNDPRNLKYSYSKAQIAAMSDKETTDALSEVWKNFCVTQSYEPGSTFKPFTVCMAYEENKIKPNQTFDCAGAQDFFVGSPWQKTIYCHERGGHGTLDVRGVVANSCNIGIAQICSQIGVEDFCRYQRKFGFGQYTDIDLPNEMSCEGLLYTKDNMTELDLSTNGFGQNFNLTMVQMSTAFCSLVNGGYLYRPHIVKGIYNSDGELLKSFDKVLVTQTISQPTSTFIKKCLRDVVTKGTGTRAAIPGYKIAGKTGTAQKYDKQEELYVISFVGFAPYENPEVLCYVAIDEPKTGDQSMYSSILFNQIMTEVLSYMNVAPDDKTK